MSEGSQRADGGERRDPKSESRVRGLMLGLGLGDSFGGMRAEMPAAGLIPAGVNTQLAAFTAERSELVLRYPPY